MRGPPLTAAGFSFVGDEPRESRVLTAYGYRQSKEILVFCAGKLMYSREPFVDPANEVVAVKPETL
jgi:hypothetical protein